MANEIVTKIVSNQENISAFFTLVKSDLDVKKALMERFKKQIEEIAKELELESPEFDDNFGFSQRETYFHFYLPKNSPDRKYYISIGFNGSFGQFLY